MYWPPALLSTRSSRPKRVERGRDDLLGAGPLADVSRHPRAALADLRRRRFEHIPAPAGDHDRRAAADELGGGRLAEVGPAAGDDRDPTLERAVGEDARGRHRYSPSTLITSRFGRPAVELAVEDLLPGAEVQLAVGDRNDHLVVDEQVLEVRVAVVLPAPVVPVVAGVGQQLPRHLAVGLVPARWRQLVEPLERVGLEPGLVVVDPHRRSDVHRAHQRHALVDAGVADGLRHVLRDPNELPALRRVERAVDGVGGQAGEPGFEPGFTVLETARITINSLPWATAMVPVGPPFRSNRAEHTFDPCRASAEL